MSAPSRSVGSRQAVRGKFLSFGCGLVFHFTSDLLTCSAAGFVEME